MRPPFPWIFALLAALFFGLFNPLGKIAVSKMHPLVYAAVTSLFAGVLAVLALFILRKKIDISGNNWKTWLALGLVSLAIPTLLTGYAFSLASSISVGLLLRMEAFFSVLYGAVLFHEKITQIQGIGLLLGLFGAVAFATNLSGNFGGAEFIIILASAFYGTFLVFVKTSPSFGPLELTAARSWVAAVPLALMAWPYFAGFDGFAEAAGLSFFSFFLGPLAYAASVKGIGVWKTGAVAQFFSAVFSILAGIVWLNETFTAVQWASSALILAGGIIILQRPNDPGRKMRPKKRL